MSHATFRDLLEDQLYDEDCDTITASAAPGHYLIYHYDAEPAATASASVRYTFDAETARRFKLRRSNSAAFRNGTKTRRAPSK